MGSRSSKYPNTYDDDLNNLHYHHDHQRPLPHLHQDRYRCPQPAPREICPPPIEHRRRRKPRILINDINADVDVVRRSDRSFSFDESERYHDDEVIHEIHSQEVMPRKKSNWDDIDIEKLRNKKSYWDDIDIEKLKDKKSNWDDIDVEKLRRDSVKKESFWDDIDVEKLKNTYSRVENNFKNKQFERTVIFNDNSFLPHYVESIQDAYDRNCHANLNLKKICPSNLNTNNNTIFINNEPPHIPPFPIIKSKPISLFEIDEFMRKNSHAQILYS